MSLKLIILNLITIKKVKYYDKEYVHDECIKCSLKNA